MAETTEADLLCELFIKDFYGVKRRFSILCFGIQIIKFIIFLCYYPCSNYYIQILISGFLFVLIWRAWLQSRDTHQTPVITYFHNTRFRNSYAFSLLFRSRSKLQCYFKGKELRIWWMGSERKWFTRSRTWHVRSQASFFPHNVLKLIMLFLIVPNK